MRTITIDELKETAYRLRDEGLTLNEWRGITLLLEAVDDEESDPQDPPATP